MTGRILIDRAVAEELTAFTGIRISDELGCHYWSYSGAFPSESLRRLSGVFPYAYFGLPPFDGTSRAGDSGPERDAILHYLDTVRTIAPRYGALVERAASAIPPVHPECRISILIPARHESPRLFATLARLLVRPAGRSVRLSQRGSHGRMIPPEHYEVLVMGNRTSEDTALDDTLTDVEAFRDTYPNLGLRVHVLSVTHPPDAGGVGLARKLLQDIALVRLSRTERIRRRLRLATMDADMIGIPETLVESYVDGFDGTLVPVAVAPCRTGLETLRRCPLLLLAARLDATGSAILRSQPFQAPSNPHFHATINRRLLQGSSTVVSAGGIALSGGVPVNDHAEDLILDEQLAMYRGQHDHGTGRFLMRRAPHRVLPVRLLVSPRRTLAAYLRDENQYYGGGFTSATITRLTRLPDERLAELASTVGRDRGIEVIRRILQRKLYYLTRTAPNKECATRCAQRLLHLCGLRPADYSLHYTADGLSANLRNSAYLAAAEHARSIPVRTVRRR